MTDDIDFDKIKEGDEVWVRGTFVRCALHHRGVLVSLPLPEATPPFTLFLTRSAIVKHIPQPWVPKMGDVVKHLRHEYVVLAVDEDRAWIKGGDGRYVVSFSDLTFIRKGETK